jgi:hypothetical protein
MVEGHSGNGGAVYCFQNCDHIDSPTIASTNSGNGGGGNDHPHPGGAVYCFQNCNYIDSPTIISTGSGNGGSASNGTSSNGSNGANGGAVYCFQNCDHIDSPTIASTNSGNGGNGGKNSIGDGSGYNGNYGTVYGYYLCRNIVQPQGTLGTSNGPSYLHYLWSALIENVAGSTAKTALFYPAYGPYALTFSAVPVKGQPLTLQWRFITPAGDTVTGKTAVLQREENNSGTWETIYTGTGQSYNTVVPTAADYVRYRVFEGTAASPTSGMAYSELLDFTATALISGADGDLGTFDTAFTPYQFSISKAPDDTDEWTSANITLRLDNTVLDTYALALGTAKTIAFTGSAWKKILNGAHTLKIEAQRIIGGTPSGSSSFRTLTFTRETTTAQFSLMESAVATAKPERITLTLGGAFPAGCAVTAEACNNANDPSPAWEEMAASTSTASLKLMALDFANASKVAAEWGVNIRVRLERGDAAPGSACYIGSCVGDYE